MRIIIIGLCLLFAAGNINADGNKRVKNFREAKRYARGIWRDNPKTFYCDCRIKGRSINIKSCGFKPRKNNFRAKRVEWDHVVPASRLGAKIRECPGAKNRRRCLRKLSSEFNRMEADLYNLVPAVGTINAARRNYGFGDIPGEERRYGSCDFEVSRRKAEPKPDIRGDIARIYFYMAGAYPKYIKLSEQEKKMFTAWSSADPVNDWERKRAKMIEKVQGNKNKFIKTENWISCKKNRKNYSCEEVK